MQVSPLDGDEDQRERLQLDLWRPTKHAFHFHFDVACEH